MSIFRVSFGKFPKGKYTDASAEVHIARRHGVLIASHARAALFDYHAYVPHPCKNASERKDESVLLILVGSLQVWRRLRQSKHMYCDNDAS